MKKLISLLLALIMCFGCAFTLISCGDGDDGNNDGGTSNDGGNGNEGGA